LGSSPEPDVNTFEVLVIAAEEMDEKPEFLVEFHGEFSKGGSSLPRTSM
jgi:hypothetical protein